MTLYYVESLVPGAAVVIYMGVVGRRRVGLAVFFWCWCP
jgi:hypothetical protein